MTILRRQVKFDSPYLKIFLFTDIVGRNRIEVHELMHKYTYASVCILIATQFGAKFTIFNWNPTYFQIFETILSYT